MRELKQKYTNLEKMMRDIRIAFNIFKKMIEEIEFCILQDDLNNDERIFLEQSKEKILELLNKYSGYRDEDFANEISTIKKEFELIFSIEQTIYESITLQLWKKTVTPVEKRLQRGESFAYIVHCGDGIIYLPGYPEYKKTRNFDADYISASLVTDQQMATYGAKKVGLIINPDSVVAANAFDAGTVITTNEDDSIKRVYDFDNGKYIVTRIPTTKIQSPKYHEEECVKKLKARPLSNPGGAYDEVIAEDSKAKVLGVFFQTNGCEINLEDYYRALVMKEAYNVPIKPINMAVYRCNAGLEPYESGVYKNFMASLNYLRDKSNLDKIKISPEKIREILIGYYEDVVIGAFYEENIKKIIHDTFLDILKYFGVLQNDDLPKVFKQSITFEQIGHATIESFNSKTAEAIHTIETLETGVITQEKEGQIQGEE